MKTTHTMRDGTIINIKAMSTRHLRNTIQLIKRKAVHGFVVRRGGGGPSCEDFWYDEDFLQGSDAEDYLELSAYEAEWQRRSPNL